MLWLSDDRETKRIIDKSRLQPVISSLLGLTDIFSRSNYLNCDMNRLPTLFVTLTPLLFFQPERGVVNEIFFLWFCQIFQKFWLFIEMFSYSYDHYGQVQTLHHKMSTVPDPQKLFEWGFKTVYTDYISFKLYLTDLMSLKPNCRN